MALIKSCLLLLWMGFPLLIYGYPDEGLSYEFHREDSSYSFHGSFIIEAELPCLKSVVFDFEHISKFTSGAKNIKLIRKGDNWNEVSYTYRRYLFFENQSTWQRIIYPDRNELIFKMIISENNLNIMPDMISSGGYYRIIHEEGFYHMEYFQECHLNTDHIKDIYIRKVKKEAIKFLHEFREYIEKTCFTGDHEEESRVII